MNVLILNYFRASVASFWELNTVRTLSYLSQIYVKISNFETKKVYFLTIFQLEATCRDFDPCRVGISCRPLLVPMCFVRFVLQVIGSGDYLFWPAIIDCIIAIEHCVNLAKMQFYIV